MPFIQVSESTLSNFNYVKACLLQDNDSMIEMLLTMSHNGRSVKALLSDREYEVLTSPETVKNLKIRQELFDDTGTRTFYEYIQNPE